METGKSRDVKEVNLVGEGVWGKKKSVVNTGKKNKILTQEKRGPYPQESGIGKDPRKPSQRKKAKTLTPESKKRNGCTVGGRGRVEESQNGGLEKGLTSHNAWKTTAGGSRAKGHCCEPRRGVSAVSSKKESTGIHSTTRDLKKSPVRKVYGPY